MACSSSPPGDVVEMGYWNADSSARRDVRQRPAMRRPLCATQGDGGHERVHREDADRPRRVIVRDGGVRAELGPVRVGERSRSRLPGTDSPR